MQFLYIMAAFVAVALLGGRGLLRTWVFPKPPAVEPVTDQTLEVLLARLDAWLREHAPAVAKSLRPGLTAEQVRALEAEGRLRLTDELRTLYQWHDGANGVVSEFIPSHQFVPLADAVR